MNKKQWWILSGGMVIFGTLFYSFAMDCSSIALSDGTFIACSIQRYSYHVAGILLIGLGILFNFIAWLEPKKK